MPSEGMKHGQVVLVSADILSILPDKIIDDILIRLPLRDAVRTSILSKKWRYNWCRLPEWTLDQALWKKTNSLIHPTIRFTDIMYHLLTLHVGPIAKFTLSVDDLGSCPKIDNMICFLSRNGVQHLVLQFPKGGTYMLPASFFTCLQIRHLSLQNCSINPPPTFRGFDKLVSLELRDVQINFQALENLISRSPLLEQLVLHSSTFTFIQIKAPKLRSFDFKGHIMLITLINVPLLAKLSLVDDGYFEAAGKCGIAQIFESFPALEHLHLEYCKVRFLAGEVPKQLPYALNYLKHLYISGLCLDGSVMASCVLCLIRSSPALQDIKIKVHERLDPVPSDVMNEISAVKSHEVEGLSDVTFNHLRTVKLEGITGTKPEMQLIELLLATCPMLIRMLIAPGRRNKSPEARVEVLVQLSKFPRASPKAEVVYKVT